MEKLNSPAILVVDMLNDFVTGALGCDRGRAIVPATAQLLDAAREKGVPVIDIHSALAGRKELFMDGCHPNAKGASLIAEKTHAAADRQ